MLSVFAVATDVIRDNGRFPAGDLPTLRSRLCHGCWAHAWPVFQVLAVPERRANHSAKPWRHPRPAGLETRRMSKLTMQQEKEQSGGKLLWKRVRATMLNTLCERALARFESTCEVIPLPLSVWLARGQCNIWLPGSMYW